jgi:N-methylhydantoinase B
VTPVEIWEAQCPVMITKKALLPDSAGAGRQRGGLGQVMTFRNVGTTRSARACAPTRSSARRPASTAASRPHRRGPLQRRGHRRFPILPFAPGDEIELRMPGGAGFGDPREREPRSSSATSRPASSAPRRRSRTTATTPTRERVEA